MPSALSLRQAQRQPPRQRSGLLAQNVVGLIAIVVARFAVAGIPEGGGVVLTPEALGEISQFFRLLAEPTRLQLLCQLRQGPLDVASLIQATGFSQSHTSRQLGQLQRAGLVTSERDGARLLYRAEGQLVEDLLPAGADPPAPAPGGAAPDPGGAAPDPGGALNMLRPSPVVAATQPLRGLFRRDDLLAKGWR